jgi:hypothetical protein
VSGEYLNRSWRSYVANFNQSKVKSFRRCQKQYSFRYDYAKLYGGKKGNLEMIPIKKKLPLYRGSWMHALQEALHYTWAGYKTFNIQFGDGKASLVIPGQAWQDVHEVLTNQFESLFEEEREELGDLPDECERLFRAYLRRWKDDVELYDVAIIEDKPAIEVVVEVPLDKFGLEGHHFKGKLDLIVEDLEYNGLWIWDAKWVKSIPPPDERMMSPQALLYVWALREMGYPIRGFVFNYGRTKPPAMPQVLKRPAGTLSKRKNMDTDVHTYVAAMKRLHGKEWKKWVSYYMPKLRELQGREILWFRRERIPVEQERLERGVLEYLATVQDIRRREKVHVPRTYTYACKFGCEYHGLCCAEFQGLDIVPLIKADFVFAGERYGKEDLLKD